jgi:type IV pilus assembly protein PilA
MFKKLEKNEKGFTLVELVVVIAILAILAVLLVPKIMGNVDEARASRHTANARTIASEISTYNALKSTGSGGAAIKSIPELSQEVADATVLGLLDRVEKDLPSNKYAIIKVDSTGNASVEVRHSYSY